MTELRKKILTNIFEKEKRNIEKEIKDNLEYTETLKVKVLNIEEEKNVATYYHIYSDEDVLKEFIKVKNEFENLSDDKKINYITNSIFTFFALFSFNKGVGIEGYCILYLLNELRNYILAKRQEIYNPKRYKLVKKNYKRYLKEFHIDSSYYDLDRIIDELNEKENYLFDFIRNCNSRNKYLNNRLKQLEILLFNSKVETTNNRLKPTFNDELIKKRYNSLNDQYFTFLPENMEKVSVKTLKNKVILK